MFPGLQTGFKASKCKPALSQAIIRIELVRNKKVIEVKRQKNVIAQLLFDDKVEKAKLEAETIVKADFLVEALDILELMCSMVRDNVKLLEINPMPKNPCPVDMLEPVCTILYASTLVDVPELTTVVQQFDKRFGPEFCKNAKEGRNNINPRLKARMSAGRPNAFIVLNYLKEIAEEKDIAWEPDEETKAAGERFDAAMSAPNGSSVLPGGASGLGAAAYEVTDGMIVDETDVKPVRPPHPVFPTVPFPSSTHTSSAPVQIQKPPNENNHVHFSSNQRTIASSDVKTDGLSNKAPLYGYNINASQSQTEAVRTLSRGTQTDPAMFDDTNDSGMQTVESLPPPPSSKTNPFQSETPYWEQKDSDYYPGIRKRTTAEQASETEDLSRGVVYARISSGNDEDATNNEQPELASESEAPSNADTSLKESDDELLARFQRLQKI